MRSVQTKNLQGLDPANRRKYPITVLPSDVYTLIFVVDCVAIES